MLPLSPQDHPHRLINHRHHRLSAPRYQIQPPAPWRSPLHQESNQAQHSRDPRGCARRAVFPIDSLHESGNREGIVHVQPLPYCCPGSGHPESVPFNCVYAKDALDVECLDVWSYFSTTVSLSAILDRLRDLLILPRALPDRTHWTHRALQALRNSQANYIKSVRVFFFDGSIPDRSSISSQCGHSSQLELRVVPLVRRPLLSHFQAILLLLRDVLSQPGLLSGQVVLLLPCVPLRPTPIQIQMINNFNYLFIHSNIYYYLQKVF